VFTNDLDFGLLLATAGAAGPSVLQVRTLDLTPDGIGAELVHVLRDHEDVLRSGALVTLDA
jgi:predicted nuclease of predicted toxin-antitoxin system